MAEKNEQEKAALEAHKRAKNEKKRKKQLKRWLDFFRFLYHICSIIAPYRRYGHKKRYDDREYLFVSNHVCFTDVIACALSTHNCLHFIAKKGLEDSKIGKWFVNKCQCIMVNRDGSDVAAVMKSMRYLKGGESIAVFPEGTRNRTDEFLQEFKDGAAAIAIMSKTPVVPVVIVRKIWPFRMGRIYYGEPMEFSEFYGKKPTPEDIKSCDEALRNRMLEMYKEIDGKLKSKNKKK